MSSIAITFPTMFTFLAGSGQYLNWFLQDSVSLQPINSAIVTATLYSVRSLATPTDTPGTPVTFFTSVNLPYVPRSKGQFQAIIPSAFNPPLGSNYVLVVDAIVPGYNNMHWEIPATVQSGTVTILQQTLLVNPNQFRNDFPEFTDSNAYPDSMIAFWMAVATLFLNPSRWCDAIALGAELYTAHMIVLERKDLDASKTRPIGWPGISKGAINSDAAGQVTVSYDTAITLDETGGHWNLTVYGSRFLRMAKMFGAGPVQVGPCSSQAGIVTGSFNSPGAAWSGPPMLPGWLGS